MGPTQVRLASTTRTFVFCIAIGYFLLNAKNFFTCVDACSESSESSESTLIQNCVVEEGQHHCSHKSTRVVLLSLVDRR